MCFSDNNNHTKPTSEIRLPLSGKELLPYNFNCVTNTDLLLDHIIPFLFFPSDIHNGFIKLLTYANCDDRFSKL